MLRVAALILAGVVGTLAWMLAGGPAGIGYVGLYGLLALPGLPVGFALFGSRHAAGWIAGALIGYGSSALVLWLPAVAGHPSVGWLIAAWAVLTVAMFLLFRTRQMVQLPPWRQVDSAALAGLLLVVPLLVAVPFSRVGEPDSAGSRRYRAYFTADFLWHVALAAELGKSEPPIRNPYLARRPLNYYWSYFVPPAMIGRTAGSTPHAIEASLLLNALCAGLLFVATVYVYAWCIVPRAGPAAMAVILAIVAASAEGAFALVRLARSGAPLASLRDLNVDALTSWIFQSLTIDSLPRSLWYTPQHAAACALGLVALIVPLAGGSPIRATTGLLTGIPLGLAIIFSPFLGGVFCVIYGLAALWVVLRQRRRLLADLAAYSAAVIPALGALGWCIANRTFEGANGAVVFGLSRLAAAAPVVTLALAAGPIFALALAGVLVDARGSRYRWGPALVGPLVGLGLFYFVTLSKEPVWIGWRAGQIMLVTLPPFAAALFARLIDGGRRTLALGIAGLTLIIGLPTSAIDAFNAQDVENLAMGPAFRWTVAVPPDTQAATSWIRQHTPADAIVQMSIGPRGRETWTLIPTFAQRRMAAGEPISLLKVPEYDERSNIADAMFRTTSAPEAAQLARSQRVDYVYVDEVERGAFGADAIAKFHDTRYFTAVFEQGQAAVFAVR